MARYLALIDGEEGAYGVIIPDCPGCVGMGASVEDALRNAGEALSEWMGDRIADGFDPPRARSLVELRNDEALKDEFASQPIVASTPLLLDAGRTVRANFSIDAGLLSSIDEAAKRRGLTRSAFWASAARDKILAEG